MAHSERYVRHAWALDRKDWRADHPFVLAVRVLWRPERATHAVRLVCTTDHYAGPLAAHPWDPGVGWPVLRAAALWGPDGEIEAEKLRATVNGIADDFAYGAVGLAGMTSLSYSRWVMANLPRLKAVAAELTRRSMD